MDGAEEESWNGDSVRNTQLSAPSIDQNSFSTVNVNAVNYTRLSWPVVMGASGYLVNIDIVDDPTQPISLVKDSLVDGVSILFDQIEDTKYEIRIKALGKKSKGNKDSEELVYAGYSTMVSATTIPAGAKINEFVKDYLAKVSDEDKDKEISFELEAGATYTLDTIVNFGLYKIQFRGNKANHNLVKMIGKGAFHTQAGLTVKWLNFDCTESTCTAPIALSSGDIDESLWCEAEGNAYHRGGSATQQVFYFDDYVTIRDCCFAGLAKSLFTSGKGGNENHASAGWAVKGLVIDNVIAQFSNESGGAILRFDEANTGSIKSVTMKNSTLYNLVDNETNFFIRQGNASNARIEKIWNDDISSSFVFTNNTFSKTFSKKAFGNNFQNYATISITMKNNIFYDVYQLQKFVQGNTTKNFTASDNVIWGVALPADATDKTKYATEDDPGFTFPTELLDLNDPMAQLKDCFTPTQGKALEEKMGDPRYFE